MSDKVGIAKMSMAHTHAKGYVDQIMANPEAELVCIWDDDPGRGKPIAEANGVPYVQDMDAALDRNDVDAVVVDAPTVQHKDVYLAAIERGKHVFTEKALTITTEDADEVVAAVNKSGVKFSISLPSRTRGENLLIKQLVDEDKLGQISMVRARVAHAAAMGGGWFSGGSLWFVDEEQSGGGAMFDLGCHTTDMVRWIMGKPKSAVALMNTISGTYDIDDNCVATVEFENGGIAVLDSSFVHMAGPKLFEVFGTSGYVARGMPVHGQAGPPPGVRNQGVMVESYAMQAGGMTGTFTPSSLPKDTPSIMEAWISAIQSDTPLITTVDDGRNLTEILEGCYTAWRTGKRFDF